MDDRNIDLELVEEAFGKIRAHHILDVATGNGGFITFLLDNIKNFTDITGIDQSEHSLDAARKIFSRGNIQFTPMDASRMDFGDEQFDMVCISNSLHHMRNLPNVLSEMRRVCKPEGWILVSEMYRDGQTDTQLTHVGLHHWWAAVDRTEGILHNETYTRQELLDITATLGLHFTQCYDLNDLQTDPKDPELISDLDSIIDRYIQRAQKLPGCDELVLRGEGLRQRVHELGFHAATTLLVMGRK